MHSGVKMAYTTYIMLCCTVAENHTVVTLPHSQTHTQLFAACLLQTTKGWVSGSGMRIVVAGGRQTEETVVMYSIGDCIKHPDR